ncbi:hypothetical protein [Saccharopolyspora erythraea]|nr:hypothetical protein [Saccharopolyspora erythraea]QRK94081.1 hypothetical protein JQX30_09935 [Saccharopolyspora erythraea]
MPIWVPGQLTVRNPEQGWSGMSVRGYRYLGSDVDVPPVRDFVVVAFHHGHTDLHRKIDGHLVPCPPAKFHTMLSARNL